MLEEIDPIDFLLAESLGKSLGEVRALPNSEIVEWRAFLRWRSEMQRLHSR
jgi:hypothetical protein